MPQSSAFSRAAVFAPPAPAPAPPAYVPECELPLPGSNRSTSISFCSQPPFTIQENRLRQTAARRGEGRAAREHERRKPGAATDESVVCGGAGSTVCAVLERRERDHLERVHHTNCNTNSEVTLPRLPSSAPGPPSPTVAAAAVEGYRPPPRVGLAWRASSAKWGRGVGRTGRMPRMARMAQVARMAREAMAVRTARVARMEACATAHNGLASFPMLRCGSSAQRGSRHWIVAAEREQVARRLAGRHGRSQRLPFWDPLQELRAGLAWRSWLGLGSGAVRVRVRVTVGG
mgnify:CR=1 FL=1